MSAAERKAQLLELLSESFAADRFSGINIEVETGDPGLETVRYAAKLGADFIVMPSHGLSGTNWVSLDSVAERVSRHACCPVLILRRKPGAV